MRGSELAEAMALVVDRLVSVCEGTGTLDRALDTSVLLEEFEKWFAWLSALDKTVIDTSCVLLFIKSVDAQDWEKVGPLLEMDHGIMADWAMVKRVCSHFDKWCEWREEGPSAAGPAAGRQHEEPIQARTEEARRWIESGAVSTDVVKGLSGGTAQKELTKMVWDLQIVQTHRKTVGDSRVTESIRSTNDVCGAMRLATPEEFTRILPRHSEAT